MTALRTPRLWLAPLLATALAGGAARAEPLYVIEQLVVSVSSAPDGSGERIATLKSGDRVELIERAGDQVHVRLASGKDGWVRASYLSGDEPLRLRLTERDSEIARLKDEMARLQGELQAHPAAAVAPAPATGAPAEDPAPPPAAMFTDAGETRTREVWPWTLAAAVLGLAVGFTVGVLVLDRYIRRKYGGLRIW